jgi:hypothetical protein
VTPAEERAFLGGILIALYHLDGAGEGVLYMEIARDAGLRALWDVAEDLDRDHLRRQMRIASVRLPRKSRAVRREEGAGRR